MKIIYFAWIKDITDFHEETIDSDKIKNLDNLKKYITSKYPNLKKHLDHEILRFAVNQEYVVENVNLKKDDEIAVFPPVSGG